ncbi:hypothetical protein VXJ36_06445, partial [Pseudomonas nitroreducens]|uniref:hypothetical protein n=1 Tax=Pseudomonas nitroreducens TaxID=46680 RepID=UPI002F35B70B
SRAWKVSRKAGAIHSFITSTSRCRARVGIEIGRIPPVGETTCMTKTFSAETKAPRTRSASAAAAISVSVGKAAEIAADLGIDISVDVGRRCSATPALLFEINENLNYRIS